MSGYVARKDDSFALAFVISLCIHFVLLYVMIFGVHFWEDVDQPKPLMYSVTIESSNLLGGINQLPQSNQKSPVVPPKKVSANKSDENKITKSQQQAKSQKEIFKQEEKTEPQVKEQVKEPVKEKSPEPKKVENVTDAEVSLAEKKDKKIEKAEKVEKKIEKPKQLATPKVVPTQKPVVKPTPKQVENSKKIDPPKAPPQKVNQQPSTNTRSSNNSGGLSNSADIDRGYQQAMQRYLGASMNAGGQGFGGDGRGGSGMGGGILRPPEWFKYKDLLETHVRRGWNSHISASPLLASVSFRISPVGVVSDIRLVKSSGNNAYDQSVLRAVSKASPVPMPPEQFYEDFKFVEIDFSPEM